MLTQGRLVSRQPRAIKGTTPTALHHEGICIAKFFHWNNGAIPTALCGYNIHNGRYINWNIDILPMVLQYEDIFIAKYIHRNNGTTTAASVIDKQFIGLY